MRFLFFYAPLSAERLSIRQARGLPYGLYAFI
jgi:hypothetical protein